MKLLIRHIKIRAVIQGCILIFLGFSTLPTRAQSDPDKIHMERIAEKADKAYHPSTALLNGQKYYYPYRTDTGTPFLELSGDPPASVQIDGKTYHDQRIRYDMYNQIMVLDYTDVAGAKGSLILKNEWIDQVSIGRYLFRVFTDEEGRERFGQVIGEGVYTCIYFWEKQYLPDMNNGERHHFFTDPNRKSYLQFGEGRCSYKRNRRLVKCFPESLRARVREYLKTHRIRVKKAADKEIEGLLTYVNQQTGDD